VCSAYLRFRLKFSPSERFRQFLREIEVSGNSTGSGNFPITIGDEG
jgi:hypothetical protein